MRSRHKLRFCIKFMVNSMAPKLYMYYGSPPVNAVLMTAKALNIELELREMDLAKKELRKDWFMKINPSHTVPILEDNGLTIWDSHAILVYLAETYGQNSNLYSNSPKEKIAITQILNLDCGTMFPRSHWCIKPVLDGDQKIFKPKHFEAMKGLYLILERILTSSEFLAGDHLTIADISIVSTISVTSLFFPIHGHELPRLAKWFEHIQGQDFYKANEKGIEPIKYRARIKLGSNI